MRCWGPLPKLPLVPTRKNIDSSDCPCWVPVTGPQSLLHMTTLVHIAEPGKFSAILLGR
jgi:hypothetical protein